MAKGPWYRAFGSTRQNAELNNALLPRHEVAFLKVSELNVRTIPNYGGDALRALRSIAFANLLCLALASGDSIAQSPIDVGDRKQLFADGLWLGQSRGVELVVNHPTLTHERCIVPDKRWESHRIGAYNSVLQVGEELRMYYDAIASDGSRWLCLAISRDGVRWKKPDLGLVPFEGDRHTNILFPPAKLPFEPGCVFHDRNPDCPEAERFKLVCTYRPPGADSMATHVAVSADGIHFTLLSKRPAFRYSDTGNICFWDPRIRRYVGYVRVWDRWRKVGRVETTDVWNWGAEQIVFSYDTLDQEGLDPELFSGVDFYTSAAVRLPEADNVYLMFPSAYYHFRPTTARKRGRPYVRADNDGPLEIHFAISRDGIHWHRPDRRPLIRNGESDWDAGYAYAVAGLVQREKETWLYYAVAPYTHGDYDAAKDRYAGTITRAVFRRDGFVSAEAGIPGGEFTGPVLRFRGRHLYLNVRTGAGGHVRVAVLDSSGAALPGLSVWDCEPINGNYFDVRVKWRDGKLEKWQGTPVRLRFLMRDASLYSFQFREE